MNNLKDIHNFAYFDSDITTVVLSGFQWTIWRIYTTYRKGACFLNRLFYQDFNEQFEGYTQLTDTIQHGLHRCFIRISMNNLKDIHNQSCSVIQQHIVVLSGFQWTIWRIYTTFEGIAFDPIALFYQDFNEQFEGYTQPLARCTPIH